MAEFKHETVLLNESVDALNIKSSGIYIDGTFGLGGHSRHILSKLGPEGRLIAIDRDPNAIKAAEKLADKRFSIIHGTFSAIEQYSKALQITGRVDGVLLDLGVSSPQLDDASRGFSFMRNGELDMRMDPTQGVSAKEWLMSAEISEIVWVLKTFGEERFAKRIAQAVFNRNQQNPLTTTGELAELIAGIYPRKERNKHPATRSFQAIRIYINSEMEEIKTVLTGIVNVLAPSGRLAVISFHSLEDRIVKQFIRHHGKQAQVPAELPLTEEQLMKYRNYQLKSLGKFKPMDSEIQKNPRSRSAVLRVAEKV